MFEESIGSSNDTVATLQSNKLISGMLLNNSLKSNAFKNKVILKDIQLEITPGEFLFLIGYS